MVSASECESVRMPASDLQELLYSDRAFHAMSCNVMRAQEQACATPMAWSIFHVHRDVEGESGFGGSDTPHATQITCQATRGRHPSW